jgi:hypothetical protein
MISRLIVFSLVDGDFFRTGTVSVHPAPILPGLTARRQHPAQNQGLAVGLGRDAKDPRRAPLGGDSR